MEKDFRLEKIGKRMPYRMPEGFMEEMKTNVLQGIQSDCVPQRAQSRFALGILFRSAVAAAAAVTLFVISFSTMQPKKANGYSDVEKAFDNLSYEDQSFMLETYNDDVFVASADYTNM